MSLQDLHNFDVFAGERSIEKAFSPTLSFESFPAAANILTANAVNLHTWIHGGAAGCKTS